MLWLTFDKSGRKGKQRQSFCSHFSMRSYNKSGKMKSKHSCVQKRIFKSAEVGIIISPKPVNRC